MKHIASACVLALALVHPTSVISQTTAPATAPVNAAPMRTAVTSGDWSKAETWKDGAVPGEGDAISVGDGVTVTVKDERTVGASGPAGTVAIQLNKTGAIVVAKGGLLRVRGDVVYTPPSAQPAGGGQAAATLPAITVEGGGRWRWDSSKAAEPAKTQYRFGPVADFGYRPFVLAGTPEARAELESDPSGGCGYLSLGGKTYGGAFIARHANIALIGDDKTPGWQIGWYKLSGKNVTWDVQHCHFTKCGVVKIVTGGMDGDATFRHSRNVHQQSQGKAVFSAFAGGGAIAKGTREIVGNVFDIAAAEGTYADGYTIVGNYFGGGLNVWWQSDPWAKCEGNFYRIFDQWCWVSGKRLADSFVFIDRDWVNPHVMFGTNRYTTDVDGLIFSHGGTNAGDSGEWVFVMPGCHHSIFLPNAYGYSTGEMTATGAAGKQEFRYDHNTWFGGKGKQWAKYPGFAAFQYSESGNNSPGVVKSFRANIMWNPQLPGKEAAFCKMNDCHSMAKDQKDGPPVEDVGRPEDIDYNAGWGYTKDADIDFENKAHYKNWGRGYIGNWSRTPGEHDVDVDPEFVDYQRDVQLYATKCLGLNPSRGQWTATPEKPYAVGDTVLNSTGILWGEPVLYRYIGSGANPEPGAGTVQKGDKDEWRKSWEWASLHAIREAVAAGKRFSSSPAAGRSSGTDRSISPASAPAGSGAGAPAGSDATAPAEGDDAIMHMIKWVRAGYAPTNPKLKGAAHDGSDIGAVPWQPKPATAPAR